MRVAVTGAAGYIGGWLLAELMRRGHEVHAQDLSLPNTEYDQDDVWHSFSTFDLCDPVARSAWLRASSPDVVVHLAALYGRVWGEVDMVKTAGMNAGLTAALARDCKERGARLMYMSSSEVYGSACDRGTVYPFSRLEPLNMYGMSKKWGEEAAWAYCPDGLMVTRLNMPYGPAYFTPAKGERTSTSGQPGTVGYNVLHSMVWEAESGLDLVVHRGTERCLTWVGDAVRGLAVIMETPDPYAQIQRGVTYNVCRNDDHRPVEELAKLVVARTGCSSKIIVEDPPPRVTLRKSLDNYGLQRMGWRPEVGIEEGLDLTREYYRKFDRDGVWRG